MNLKKPLYFNGLRNSLFLMLRGNDGEQIKEMGVNICNLRLTKTGIEFQSKNQSKESIINARVAELR